MSILPLSDIYEKNGLTTKDGLYVVIRVIVIGNEGQDHLKILRTIIQGVYRKTVIWLRYYSEIGTLYFSYLWTCSPSFCLRFMAYIGKYDEAMSIVKAGIESNHIPADNFYSYLLTFAYAEAQKIRKYYRS